MSQTQNCGDSVRAAASEMLLHVVCQRVELHWYINALRYLHACVCLSGCEKRKSGVWEMSDVCDLRTYLASISH